jgi:hypothetical protein
LELSREVEAALEGLPKWRSQVRGGTLCFRNEEERITLTVRRLPFPESALSGEVKLDGPSGRYALTLAKTEDVPDEVIKGWLVRLGFGNEPVIPLLDRLVPIIHDFLFLQMPRRLG